MTLEAVSTAEASAPAATPAHDSSSPKEVRVVSDKELAQRSEDELNAKLSKVFKEAKRERSDDGKFSSKNPSSEEGDAAKALTPDKPEKAEKAAEKPADKAPKAETKPEAPAKYEAPKHWSDSAKERFAKLDPETQKEFIETAKSERQALSKLGQAVKQFEPVGRVLQEHKDTFERRGMSYEQGISQLLKAQDALDTNPEDAIRRLAQAYRVDLSQLAGVPGQGQPYKLPPDPEVEALRDHIAHLEEQLGSVTGYVSQSQQMAYEARVTELSSAIDAFAKDKPDFDDVADLFQANFVQIKRANPGLSTDAAMAQAYDAARWSNPATRQKALEAEIKAAEEKRQKALRDAQKANALNVSSSPGAMASSDLDDKLRAIARRRAA